jgi:CRISPR-associated protein Cas1
MTFHIITIFNTGSRLSCERGFLVCKYPDGDEKRIALTDVRGIVIANPAVSFTNECLARLLEQDAVVLHCDRHFKPIGWTASLDRVTRREVFLNQVSQSLDFNRALWNSTVLRKMRNQAALLDYLNVEHNLHALIEKPLANEANVSRQFWGNYFQSLGKRQRRERKGAESFENKALNYGYAVLSTLTHRAILIHGLLPSLGIHHEARFRSHPLVYDLMEPFRSFIDLLFYEWMQENPSDEEDEAQFKSWIYFLMNSLRECRIKHSEDKHSYKLMDAVDCFVRSIATCFETRHFKNRELEPLWLPRLEEHYWLKAEAGEPGDDNEESNIAV